MPSYLPLRAVISQSLLLMFTIAIEAFILRQQLSLSHKKSVEYSATVNLLSTVVGWLIFLSFAPSLPDSLELQLLNFIFFDQWSTTTATWLIAAGFITFFTSFVIEFLGLEQLQLLLGERKNIETPERYQRPRSYPTKRLSSSSKTDTTSQSKQADTVYAMLVANAASYSVTVLTLLVFRLFSEAQLIPSL